MRAIDGDELLGIERLLDTDVVRQSKTASWLIDQVLHDIQAMPTLTQPNEPLTLEELREMDGEPVFLKTGEVAIREQLIAEWEILTEHDDSWFYFTRRKRGFHIKDYGKTWIAYRRPPEGEV